MIDKSTKVSIGAMAVCLPFVVWIGTMAWGMQERGIRTEEQLAAVVDVLQDIRQGIRDNSLEIRTAGIPVLKARLDGLENRIVRLEQ